MILRDNILHYLYDYGNVEDTKAVNDIFERINSSVFVFTTVINDLITNKIIICKGLNTLASEQHNLILPENLSHLQLFLTPEGKNYVERKVKKIIPNRNDFGRDNMDYVYIENNSIYLPAVENLTFEEFKKNFKHLSMSIDIRVIYYILTGKYVSLEPTRIFISYSHDSKEHKEWVKQFAIDLSKSNNVILDQIDFKFGMPQHETMKSAILQAVKVIIILTPDYKEKAENKIGSGVNYEFSILTEDLIKKMANDKYIPILRHGTRENSIPNFIKGYFDCDMRDDKLYQENLDLILHQLQN